MSDLMKIGADMGAAGAFKPLTAGISGAQRVSDAHGRFMQAALEGRLFSDGMAATSISAATFTTGTLGATGTPIVGVWNPLTSNKNLVILQATMAVTVFAATATGPGVFAWAMSTGNGLISTGNAPLNRLTMVKSGSAAKGLSGVAMTGQTNALVVMMGAVFTGGNLKSISSVETAVGQNIGQAGTTVENFDGSLIVPPGGILALLSSVTAVGHTAASALLWEELPILVQG